MSAKVFKLCVDVELIDKGLFSVKKSF